jgi:lipopolysaccharide/colanic/teichoic acid biosynthesis glycosyltransferase
MASSAAQTHLPEDGPESFPLLEFSPCWRSPAQRALKRLLDIAVSVFLLILLCPLFLVAALAIKLTSRGPVFFPWRVVGRNGVPFTGYKFRSMVADAEKLRDSLVARNEMTGPMFKITNDPRITPVGAILRRYSIDELPQLYSVLKGDMSLVGPRPPLAREYAVFTEFQKQKLAVTPGMTCLWQVSGRNEIRDFDEWVKLDLDYIRRWSLFLDVKILFQTAMSVIGATGR